MKEIEREIKVLNIDLSEFEKRLIKLGAKYLGQEYQENIVIENETDSIEKNLNAYLRIRTTEKKNLDSRSSEFTLKKIIKDKEFKTAEEITTSISDKDKLLEILENLGFHIKYRGYKNRKSYLYKSARIDLDIWDKDTYPYPYAEIEFTNSKEKENILKELAINPKDIVLDTITELRRKL
ncbi:MAG: class IV adenylate cyclase [Tissierellia bacterium]|nr:class IV adenylate cyclase [Tissierellia bacterium]